MFIFYQPEIKAGVLELDREESRHCIKVLRKKEGDAIRLTDGKGFFYEAVISDANAKACGFEIASKEELRPDPFHIHIALAPTKNLDRTEWFVEKAIEIGVHRISFILCENAERKVLKTERLLRKAISAMKQSQQAYLPELGELTDFEAFVQQQKASHQLIAYLDEQARPYLINAVPPTSDYLVLIGPEGDFSDQEVEQAVARGYQPVSLGNSRLRTETAGIAACHSLQLLQLHQPS
jgi:16S rRNA (uracil1498-N3)-methyltransferase